MYAINLSTSRSLRAACRRWRSARCRCADAHVAVVHLERKEVPEAKTAGLLLHEGWSWSHASSRDNAQSAALSCTLVAPPCDRTGGTASRLQVLPIVRTEFRRVRRGWNKPVNRLSLRWRQRVPCGERVVSGLGRASRSIHCADPKHNAELRGDRHFWPPPIHFVYRSAHHMHLATANFRRGSP